MTVKTIAFLGAGTMGSRMLRHLVRNGYLVKVFNRTRERLLQFADEGCQIVESPTEAAVNADAILSCVSDDSASEFVWFGPTGAINSARPRAIAIELSTLSLPYLSDWSERIVAAGLVPIDAPITGSTAGAEAGDLTAFVGASEGLEAAKSILNSFCSTQIHFGPTGSGMQFKLVYNMVGGGIGAVFAEGLNLLEKLGISSELALDTFKSTGWASAVAQSKGTLMLKGRYEPAAFKARYMLKDVLYALAAARQSGARAPFGELVASLYANAVSQGAGDMDFSVIKATSSDWNALDDQT